MKRRTRRFIGFFQLFSREPRASATAALARGSKRDKGVAFARLAVRSRQGKYNQRMKIFMACPAPAGSRKGNRVTAKRWASILKGLGHRVVIGQDYDGSPADLLVALHARRSYQAVESFRQQHPELPLVVALTGTDFYSEIHRSRKHSRSLKLASQVILLQPA